MPGKRVGQRIHREAREQARPVFREGTEGSARECADAARYIDVEG